MYDMFYKYNYYDTLSDSDKVAYEHAQQSNDSSKLDLHKIRIAMYEQYFSEWSKVCDVAGQFTFSQMQRMASIRMDVDGDIGFLMVGRQDAFPQLQLIESHNILSQDLKWSDTGHDGVKVSASGRPTAYNIKDGDDYRSISANNFILVYDPDRVAQLRGVSALAHAIDHVRDATDILEFE